MPHNARHAVPQLATPGRARKLTSRAAVALALVAAVLLSVLGVSSTLVGAVTTDSSKVTPNRFAVVARIDAGPYELAAVPANGTMFGPGADTGEVTFSMQPEGADPIAVDKGDEFTLEVLLPADVRPGSLPAADEGAGFRRTWSSHENNGKWSVRSVVTAKVSGSLELPAGAFDIETDFPNVRSDEELTLHATIAVPERFMSTHPEESAILPASWNVVAGVYRLGMSGSTASSAAVRFSSHPDGAGERLHLREGDIMTTTVSLPATVTPGRLPATTTQGGITASWSSERTENGWDVTLIETVTRPIATMPTKTRQFPATLSESAWDSGFEMSAETTLPERFASAQPMVETKVPGRITSPGLGRVSAGAGQSLAITNNRLVNGWGYNANGRVGNDSTTNVMTPTRIGSYPGQEYLQISAGGNHTVGLTANQTVYGWGARQWALSGGLASEKPVEVSRPASGAFNQVSAGLNHSLALNVDGRAFGWGYASSGELGADQSLSWPAALQNPAGVTFTQLEAGAETTFGLAADGKVWGMGSNADSRLGLRYGPAQVSKFTQIPMPDGARIVQIVSNSSTTNSHTLALTDHGEVIAWGLNASGQGGTALNGAAPTVFRAPTKIQLPEGVRFSKLAVGDNVSLGLSYDGSVYSWGGKTLGYVASGKVAVPRQVSSLPASGGFADITAGDAHAFALGNDGKLYGWGLGLDGRLGNNSMAAHTVPVLIPQSLSRNADETDATDDATDDATAVEEVEDEATDSSSDDSEADLESNCPDCILPEEEETGGPSEAGEDTSPQNESDVGRGDQLGESSAGDGS